mmetsp:Transcript_82364/g.233364  ORF Transcript_82364/g.233364 Transcript_82364/m.233364 type:complete len:410 (-) Transcript_82364:55-1284(-)
MPGAIARWGARKSAWSRSWTWAQVASHAAVAYPICCFAALSQPAWQRRGRRGDLLLIVVFWLDFAVSLALYFFVCLADTRYREASRPLLGEYESRRCEECVDSITRLRVKHCQTCGKCTEDFDHHCRYLNVCVGGRTYSAWLSFVVGLLALMATCGYAAAEALAAPDRFSLAITRSTALSALLWLQAGVSLVLGSFLLCLLAQHLYFIYEGITTLEYIKDQAAGFPALPPRGWREAVRHSNCYACNDDLELIEVDDTSEVWFCTVCQADVGKAGVEFYSCERCDNVNVCPLCFRAARRPDAPIVTYRVSSLRRRAEAQAWYPEGKSRARPASLSTQREPRFRRRTLAAVVAAVEGHMGDTKVCSPSRAFSPASPRGRCRRGCPCRGEGEEHEDGDDETGSSSGESSDFI